MYGAVREFMRRGAYAARGQDRPMSDGAQRQHDAQARHGGHLLGEKFSASLDLRAEGLVAGRYATHRIGDAAVDEGETIVQFAFVCAPAEAMAVQGAVEQIAGEIPGEGPARAIGAFEPRCEANDQESRAGGAEARYRRVEEVRISGPILTTQRRQAWTGGAIAIRLEYGRLRRQRP